MSEHRNTIATTSSTLQRHAGAFLHQEAVDRLVDAGALFLRASPSSLPVRLYRPAGGRLPVLFHLHGGDGIAGSLGGHDPALRRLAMRTGWIVAAPDDRLAPDARFPAQLGDARAVLDMMADEADRLVVSGDSIGGTPVAALTMMARDRGGPTLAGQISLYPDADL